MTSGSAWNWNGAIGPFYDADGLAKHLHLTSADIERMVQEGQLIGVHTSDGLLVIPSRQFGDTIGPIPGLPAVVALLRSAFDEWTIALWLLSLDRRPGGLAMVELLREGRTDPVMIDARHAVTAWLEIVYQTDVSDSQARWSAATDTSTASDGR